MGALAAVISTELYVSDSALQKGAQTPDRGLGLDSSSSDQPPREQEQTKGVARARNHHKAANPGVGATSVPVANAAASAARNGSPATFEW